MRTIRHLCLVAVMICCWSGSWAVGQAGRPTVYLEDSPAAQELFDEAQSLRRQDRLIEAAERIQQVIEKYPRKLMPIDGLDDVYEDALLQAYRKLIDDRELREAYRSRYTAIANRHLTAALEPSPASDALEQVAGRYAMTEPGFEAGLLLAGYYLERADGRSAASVLDTFAHHPDMAHQRGRYDYLQAVAGLLGRERDRLHHHRKALLDHDETETVSDLDALANRLHPPLRLNRSDQAAVDVGDLPELLRRPLWETEVDFSASPSEMRGGVRAPRVAPSRPSGRENDHHPPVLPTAGEQRLYVNEGHQLRALDRNSGWTMWQFEWTPDETEQPAFAQFGRMAGAGAEPQPVLLHGRFAFAVMGHSAFWPARWQPDHSPTMLVAVDRDTGEPLWQVEPTDLDATFERSNFQGVLLASDDVLFALIRRSQASGFQDTFLVALDQRDGSLRWRRHLSSAATTSRYATGPRPEMAIYGSSIYVSDNIGSVAAIDIRHGTLRWAHVFSPDRNALERGVLRGDMSSTDRIGGAPLLTSAGLIVPSPALEGRAVYRFDAATGQIIDTLSSKAWTNADHLLFTEGDILAVGSEVTLFDGKTLKATWSYRLENEASPQLVGYAAVSRKYVLVPTEKQIVMLHRDTGDVARRIEVDAAGNVLVFDGQLVVATHSAVRSYLDWRRAAEHLRRQVRDQPSDPSPGLALAHLAMRAEQAAVVLEGVDASIEALRQRTGDHDRRQADVFTKLRDLTDIADDDSHALRGELFDRMATITAGPEQEVVYHLAVASHYTDTEQSRQAVEHLQAVLLDETLSVQLHEQPQVARQAGLEAKRRLMELVRREGRAIYGAFDARAERRLDQLLARGAAADELTRLADQYPLAHAAPRALREAGRRHAEADKLASASQQFRRAYEYAQREAPDLLPGIVGELAEIYVRHDRPRQAAAWLERVRQRHTDLQPLRAGEPVSISAWLTELAGREGIDRNRPQLALPLQQPRLLAGRPLPLAEPTSHELSRDRLLTLEGETLRLYAGRSFDIAWERPLPDASATALSVNDRQVLLWLDDPQALAALHSDTGETMWETIRAADVLDEAGTPRLREAARPQQQREFIEMIEVAPVRIEANGQPAARTRDDNTVFQALGDQIVVLADARGRVVGIDRDTGRVQWSRLTAIDQVTTITANTDTITLVGAHGVDTDAVSGMLIALDIHTGEPRFPAVEDSSPPEWVGFAGSNLIAVATAKHVAAYQITTGEPAWRLSLSEQATPLAGQGWADEHLILLLDNIGMALAIEASSGQLLNRLSLAGLAENISPSRVIAETVAPNWHLLTPGSLIAVDGRGQITWRDAISLPRKQFVRQFNSRDHVIVMHREPTAEHAFNPDVPDRQVIRVLPDEANPLEIERHDRVEADMMEDGRARYRMFIIERHSGRLVAERALGPISDPLDHGPALLLDNQIVFTAGDKTLVVPGTINDR